MTGPNWLIGARNYSVILTNMALIWLVVEMEGVVILPSYEVANICCDTQCRNTRVKDETVFLKTGQSLKVMEESD